MVIGMTKRSRIPIDFRRESTAQMREAGRYLTYR